jgi:DNA-binding winged helix-turn-helix (wHTH) protein/tetratricopeptide (TPR) repeat protein
MRPSRGVRVMMPRLYSEPSARVPSPQNEKAASFMADPSGPLRFDDFELDEGNALLTRSGRQIQLPPKAFAVLCVLARQPGKLADKNALLDEVWGHRFVSESVLKSTISQVRTALADDAGEPRYIETVPRRGYRFIGRAAATHRPFTAPVAAAPAQVVSGQELTGRKSALARLHSSWQRAQAGDRQLVWIAGEAGIGKTTVVDRFVADIGAASVAQGQCIEQFGAGAPYLPIFEALKSLCRRDAAVVPLLRQVAPTWLVQMPWLVADADRAALQAEVASAGQDRMVREFIELCDTYSQQGALLLVTEDLHWSDDATLRLLDHFARRRAPLRILWVATFRLTQIIAEAHALKALRQELQLHRLCDEILLDAFSEKEVGEYVQAQLPGATVPEAFVKRLHVHTDGLPLFVANVIDGLKAQNSDVAASVTALAGRDLPVPDNLTGAIERQIERLPADARALLEAASVCGVEFSARIVAAMLGVDAARTGRICDELVRQRYWLREVGVVDLPDGNVDTRYAFQHALYRHVFYRSLVAARRVTYHREVARSSAAAGSDVTASELASHYELGHEYLPALRQYLAAAKNALSKFAPREAIDLTGRAIAFLPRLAASQEVQELELELLAKRGHACQQALGVSSPEAVQAFERVRELCEALPPSAERVLLLSGLGWGYTARGEFAAGHAIAERILASPETDNSLALQVNGCNMHGILHAQDGRLKAAREWLLKGLALCEQLGERPPAAVFLIDPEASMRSNLAPLLLNLGYADQARVEAARAIARGERTADPFGRVLSLWCACLLYARLSLVEEVAKYSTALGRVVAETGVRQGVGPSLWFRGWVEARRLAPRAGLALILDGYAQHESLGMYAGCTEVLGYAAEAALLDDRYDAAQRHIDDALALSARIGEEGMLCDLLLLQARIAAARGEGDAARAWRERALAAARAEDALGWEINALVANAENPERTPADIAALAAAYARLTEGFDTFVAARARALLAETPAAGRRKRAVRKSTAERTA